MKKLEEDLDLSLIKENDLDNTAAFTDLMSRSERRKYKKEKERLEDKTVEFQTEDLVMQVADEKKVDDIKFKDELENLSESNDKKKKKKEKKKKIDKEKIEEEEIEQELSKTQKLFELTSNINIYETKKNSSMTSVIILSIFIVSLLIYYIYSIINSSFENDIYLFINGFSLLTIVLLYCITLISTNKLSKVMTVIDYIFIISTILFNLLIYFKVI